METLLVAGADSDLRSSAHGGTPLMAASNSAAYEPMLTLLQHGAAVNARNDFGGTPLHLVCAGKFKGVEAAVSLLLGWAADVLDSDWSDDEEEQPRCSPQEIVRVRALLARGPPRTGRGVAGAGWL